MLNRNKKPLAMLLAALTLSACGSDSGFNEDTDFLVEDGFVQFVNMMPDSPEVLIIHGLERTSSGFPLAQAVEQRPADKYDWRIVYLDSNDDEVTIAEGDDQLIEADRLSTFLWMGNLAQPNIQIVDAPFVTSDSRTAGVSDIWFASNLTNHSMVDIYLTSLDTKLSDASPLISVTSGNFTNRLSVDAGINQRIRITTAGSSQLLFDSGALEIIEKTEDFYAIVDDFGPDGENHANVIRTVGGTASTIQDNSQPAKVRIGNYTNRANLTGLLGDNVFPSIGKQTRSAQQETATGEIDFSITEAGVTLEQSALTIFPGSFQSIYTFENDTTDAASITQSIIVSDSIRLVKDRSLFKFINGSDLNINLYVLRPGQDFDDVLPFLDNFGFGGRTDNELLSDVTEYVVRNAENTETLSTTSKLLQEGVSYTLVFDKENVLHLLED